MHTYAYLCKLCTLMQISFNLFFLNIFDLCSPIRGNWGGGGRRYLVGFAWRSTAQSLRSSLVWWSSSWRANAHLCRGTQWALSSRKPARRAEAQSRTPFPLFASRFRLSHPRQCLSKIPGKLFRHLAMWVDWIRLVCSCFIPSVQKICNITGTMTIPLAGRKGMLH